MNVSVGGKLRGLGQADANGCISIVVTALSKNKVLIRTFGPSGPVTFEPVRVHKRAGAVVVSEVRNGVLVGLSMAFTIVVKAHPPTPAPPPPKTHKPKTTIPKTTTTTIKKRTKKPKTPRPPIRRPAPGPGPGRRAGPTGGQIIAGTYIPPFVPSHLTPKQTRSAVVAIAAAAGAVAALSSLGGAAAAGGSAGAVGAAGAGGTPTGGEAAAEAEVIEIEADRIDDELPEWEAGGLDGSSFPEGD